MLALRQARNRRRSTDARPRHSSSTRRNHHPRQRTSRSPQLQQPTRSRGGAGVDREHAHNQRTPRHPRREMYASKQSIRPRKDGSAQRWLRRRGSVFVRRTGRASGAVGATGGLQRRPGGLEHVLARVDAVVGERRPCRTRAADRPRPRPSVPERQPQGRNSRRCRRRGVPARGSGRRSRCSTRPTSGHARTAATA